MAETASNEDCMRRWEGIFKWCGIVLPESQEPRANVAMAMINVDMVVRNLCGVLVVVFVV